jgi:hypothetical protein
MHTVKGNYRWVEDWQVKQIWGEDYTSACGLLLERGVQEKISIISLLCTTRVRNYRQSFLLNKLDLSNSETSSLTFMSVTYPSWLLHTPWKEESIIHHSTGITHRPFQNSSISNSGSGPTMCHFRPWPPSFMKNLDIYHTYFYIVQVMAAICLHCRVGEGKGRRIYVSICLGIGAIMCMSNDWKKIGAWLSCSELCSELGRFGGWWWCGHAL